ncbi:MAG: YfiR family protein [Verrucomicrobia bacterium]|nr:YfiR family protein [Verrucomicrobiota bacterium]
MAGWISLFVWLLAAAHSARPVPGAALASAKDHQIKAAYLFNFAKFVEWPKAVFADASSPITIGVFGRDPFGGDLELMVRNKTAGGRKVEIKRFEQTEGLAACQILFIPAVEEDRWPEIFAAIRNSTVLTVGETARFIEEGGIISLTPAGKKVGITIDIDAAERARLVLSSHLQNLAVIIRTGRPKQRK